MEVTALTDMHSERTRGSDTSCFKGNAIWICKENSLPLDTVNRLPKEVMESPLREMNS